MPLVSDSFHKEKLNKYNINIKTKYIVDNDICERNTNNSLNDDIKKGIRCCKEYYINNILKHTEKEFDSRIEYTFIAKDQENKEYNCPNCGMTSLLKDVTDGCPYCKTYYNIDYLEKDLGSKYHYDYVVHNNLYRIVTGIIDLIISILLSYLFIKSTSRTFNNIDVIKVFVYGLILSLLLYYLFYMVDAYIVLGPLKKYKEKQNKKQKEFWERTKIDKKTFYNNLNYEIKKYYYSFDNIIDYDILDYLSFKEYYKNNKMYVDVKIRMRIIYYNNGKIIPKSTTKVYTLFKNDKGVIALKDGVNVIMCSNCGASIDVNKSECDYCHTKIEYLGEWILDNKK